MTSPDLNGVAFATLSRTGVSLRVIPLHGRRPAPISLPGPAGKAPARVRACPPLAPVGPGSSWRELDVRVWPFDGTLDDLLESREIVIADTSQPGSMVTSGSL